MAKTINWSFKGDQKSEEVVSKTTVFTLDGNGLKISDLVQFVNSPTKYEIRASNEAIHKVKTAHKLLITAGSQGHQIYGLTTGVGVNKDRPVDIFEDGELTEEGKQLSEEFNANLIRSHCASYGELMDVGTVQGIMLTRLNCFLLGRPAVSIAVVNMYIAFLNNHISPLIPGHGSIGEADITMLAHVGLAMMGEGDVVYKGKFTSAESVLKSLNLAPLKPYAKDALSIVSSNTVTAVKAALLSNDVQHTLRISHEVFCLSLEGINGNIAPFLKEVNKERLFGQQKSAQIIRNLLDGSYLLQKHRKRFLQDPLSYRNTAYALGAAMRDVEELQEMLKIQLNSSDDNPTVFAGDVNLDEDFKAASEQVSQYYILGDDGNHIGAVVPTANFVPLPWVLKLEALGISLAHVANHAVQRSTRLLSDHSTNLTRYLGEDDQKLAFQTLPKPLQCLNVRVSHLCYPVSVNPSAAALSVEDVATNSLQVLHRLTEIRDCVYRIIGIELMLSAQAVDLRFREFPRISLSAHTQKLYDAYRKEISFRSEDRPISNDIEISAVFVQNL